MADETLDSLRAELAEYRHVCGYYPQSACGESAIVRRALDIAIADCEARIEGRVKEISYEFHPRRMVLKSLLIEFECYGETDEVKQTRPVIKAAVAELDAELARHWLAERKDVEKLKGEKKG